jgi:hypothetical protein
MRQDALEPSAGKEAMVFKPNYNQQRAERNRAKQAKQEAKRLEKEEQVARRRQGQTEGGTAGSEPPTPESGPADAT